MRENDGYYVTEIFIFGLAREKESERMSVGKRRGESEVGARKKAKESGGEGEKLPFLHDPEIHRENNVSGLTRGP